jgi:hypothetical protein
MAPSTRFVTDEQLTVIGRRDNSDDVGMEVSEMLARWRRDLGGLASLHLSPRGQGWLGSRRPSFM